VPPPQAGTGPAPRAPDGRWSGLRSDALIELVRRCRLTMWEQNILGDGFLAVSLAAAGYSLCPYLQASNLTSLRRIKIKAHRCRDLNGGFR
jgi:hypothetical protein